LGSLRSMRVKWRAVGRLVWTSNLQGKWREGARGKPNTHTSAGCSTR